MYQYINSLTCACATRACSLRLMTSGDAFDCVLVGGWSVSVIAFMDASSGVGSFSVFSLEVMGSEVAASASKRF